MGRQLSFDPALARKLLLEGGSDTEVAKVLGVAQPRVSSWRRAQGIQIHRKCWACGVVFAAPNGNGTHCGKCGLRKCSACKTVKPVSCFSVNQATPDGINNVCKPCVVARHRPNYRRYGLKHRWGLTEEELTGLWEAQARNCAICRSPLLYKDIRIDHDASHCVKGCRTCIRGLAHHGCNVGIGYFYENPQALRNAAIYLEERGEAGEAFHAPPHPDS